MKFCFGVQRSHKAKAQKSSFGFPSFKQATSRFAAVLFVCCGFLAGASTAQAATYTFTGNSRYGVDDTGACVVTSNGTGDWDDPRNWGPPCSPAGPPTSADTAIIANGAAVITHDVTLAGLTFSGGIIGGNDYTHSVTVTNAFKWSGGTFVYNISYGSVAVICGPNCITTTTGGAGQYLTTSTFTNQGTLNWKGPSSISAYIVNSGTINLQNDGFFCGSVFNSGTIKKSAGAGFSDLDSFQNTGTIDVQTGTLACRARPESARFMVPQWQRYQRRRCLRLGARPRR